MRQQVVKRRVKRGLLQNRILGIKFSHNPNDPLWPQMWYLVNYIHAKVIRFGNECTSFRRIEDAG